MKVRATHWVNHNGKWYSAGQEYETDDAGVETSAEPVRSPSDDAMKPDEPPKRGRKRKTEE